MDVRAAPQRADLAAFAQAVLGSGTEVTADHLREHCAAKVRAALDAFARAHPAAALLIPATWEAFGAVLAEHFKPLGFASGLVLGPNPRVTFESPGYASARRKAEVEEQRQRRQEAEGQLRAAEAEARRKHLGELQELLARLKQLRAENPALSMVDLVKMFDPGQRGLLYAGLGVEERPARRTEAVVVVAGDELIRLDPAELSRAAQRWNLSSPAGPLRSVRLAGTKDERLFLVGARWGVHLVGLDGKVRRTCLLQGPFELRGGFNASVLLGGFLYATHSEVGLVRWPVEEGAAAPSDAGHELCLPDVTAGAKTVRGVQADDSGRLWFSVDRRVVGWTPDQDGPPTLLPVPVMIEALLAADGQVYAGLEDGRIVRWAMDDAAMEPPPKAAVPQMESVRGPTGSPVQSLGWVRGGGVPRLLIADGRSQIDLQVVGDSFVGAYRCEQKLRWGFAAEDWIVGVNDRRDQVLLWRWNEPDQPAERVSIGQFCGRSVQDIVLLPADQA
jgi:hypothetical protein